MNQLRNSLVAKSRTKIRFLTSMFYVTLNSRELNYYFYFSLLSEFLILDLAGIPSRDVIGWHDS